jgi:hypothetical protein
MPTPFDIGGYQSVWRLGTAFETPHQFGRLGRPPDMAD